MVRITPCSELNLQVTSHQGEHLLPASVTVWPVQVLHHQVVYFLLPLFVTLLVRGLVIVVISWCCILPCPIRVPSSWGSLHTVGAAVGNGGGPRTGVRLRVWLRIRWSRWWGGATPLLGLLLGLLAPLSWAAPTVSVISRAFWLWAVASSLLLALALAFALACCCGCGC